MSEATRSRALVSEAAAQSRRPEEPVCLHSLEAEPGSPVVLPVLMGLPAPVVNSWCSGRKQLHDASDSQLPGPPPSPNSGFLVASLYT